MKNRESIEHFYFAWPVFKSWLENQQVEIFPNGADHEALARFFSPSKGFGVIRGNNQGKVGELDGCAKEFYERFRGIEERGIEERGMKSIYRWYSLPDGNMHLHGTHARIIAKLGDYSGEWELWVNGHAQGAWRGFSSLAPVGIDIAKEFSIAGQDWESNLIGFEGE